MPVGLRPEAFREIRLALGITTAQWRDLFPDIRVMEQAALAAMHAQKGKG